MAIDPPYRLDPFRNLINIHFKEKEEPPQGPEHPGIIIYCNPWIGGVGPWRNTSILDFVLVINSVGPFSSGNPLWDPDEYPHPPGSVDAGELLPQSNTTYYSMSIAVVSWVSGPDPSVIASMVAYDWYIVSQRISYVLSLLSGSDQAALQPFLDDAYNAAKNTYDNYVEANGTGQYQSDINYMADPLPM